MTTHYVDITLLPDPEFSHAHLLSALYAKLHRSLVQLKANDIGVSFPQYSLHPRALGAVMRLHGSVQALMRLAETDWLTGMRDHVALSPLAEAPPNAQHRAMRRRQFKTSLDRLRRRRMQRKEETFEQVLVAIPSIDTNMSNLPFVQMRSSSTGQTFLLFIDLQEPQARAESHAFNAYGLSQGGSVPWF